MGATPYIFQTIGGITSLESAHAIRQMEGVVGWRLRRDNKVLDLLYPVPEDLEKAYRAFWSKHGPKPEMPDGMNVYLVIDGQRSIYHLGDT